MGSIGDTFTPTVPAVGASGTGYATSVNAVLTELITRVSSPVPLSALSGSTLDLNNVPAIDFQYLGLYEQLAVPGASPVGRLERFENNLYWVGLSGAVKITNGANLNASGIGGIGGDYGGVNPALVSFVDAANRYDFYDDAAGLVWAHLRARSIYLSGTATGVNFAQITFGGGSNYTLTLPTALPGAGTAVLTVSNTGQIATSTVSNDIVLSGTTKVQHGDRTKNLNVINFGDYATSKFIRFEGLPNDIGIQYQTAGAGNNIREFNVPMVLGERVKSVVFRLNKTGTTVTTISVWKYSVATGIGTSLGSATSTSSGRQAITVTLGAPETVGTDEAILVKWAPGDNLELGSTIELTYDVPA